MHQVLLIQEILLDIFGHCSAPAKEERCYNADLVALARVCQTFKEPALDILWEELFELSPLARCLPEACGSKGWCYWFSGPLSGAEWNTLQGYTNRVRFLHQSLDARDVGIANALTSFPGPLFPNLRSLFWQSYEIFPMVHTAVPSLMTLHLTFRSVLHPTFIPGEFMDTLGERCPDIKQFKVSAVQSEALETAISRQLCRWSSLECADCRSVTLTMDTILCLPSMSTLRKLSFILGTDSDNSVTHLGSALVFSNLADFKVKSISLKSITILLSRVRLPKIRDLDIRVLEYTPKRSVQEFWTAVQKACPSNTLIRLSFSSSNDGFDRLDEKRRPWLTSDDLLPYKEFGNLRIIHIDVAWSVYLTDTDILDLVSTSPQLEQLTINNVQGWGMKRKGCGITLNGLVQLLRQCPYLSRIALVIDAQTFTEIPEDLEVLSFPRRETRFEGTLCLDYLDSYVAREDLLDVQALFAAIGIDARTSPFWH